MDDADGTTVVMMTAPAGEAAEGLARALVQERLAACANVLRGVRSVYWWKGEVQSDDEALVILKTTTAGVEALRSRAVELHPYDVPEVIALPVTAGHAPYLDWVRREVGA